MPRLFAPPFLSAFGVCVPELSILLSPSAFGIRVPRSSAPPASGAFVPESATLLSPSGCLPVPRSSAPSLSGRLLVPGLFAPSPSGCLPVLGLSPHESSLPFPIWLSLQTPTPVPGKRRLG